MFALAGLALVPHLFADKSNVLDELIAGNKAFVAGTPTHPREDSDTRKMLAKGQRPKAIVVCCSDSRVAPEILFDQGLGDLFVVRCAGNTVDAVALGSIEYAVLELKSKVIVVLGHEKCGAVKAAVENHRLPGSIPAVVRPIRAAVATARHQKGDTVHNAIFQNVRNVVTHISKSDSVMRNATRSGNVRVIGGVYDLDSGLVTFLQK